MTMASITYIWNSSILESDAQVIIQQCNCVSKTGAGLYIDILQAFPHANFYSHRTSPSTPGTIEVKGSPKDHQRWVCGLYAQYYPGKPSNRKAGLLEERLVGYRRTSSSNVDNEVTRLEWFRVCLDRLFRVKNLRSLAFPYNIGCGLAEGNWPD